MVFGKKVKKVDPSKILGVYLLAFFSRLLLSRDMVPKGAFFPAKHFQIYVFFFRTKKLLSKMYIIPWRIFQNLSGPLNHCVHGGHDCICGNNCR